MLQGLPRISHEYQQLQIAAPRPGQKTFSVMRKDTGERRAGPGLLQDTADEVAQERAQQDQLGSFDGDGVTLLCDRAVSLRAEAQATYLRLRGITGSLPFIVQQQQV